MRVRGIRGDDRMLLRIEHASTERNPLGECPEPAEEILRLAADASRLVGSEEFGTSSFGQATDGERAALVRRLAENGHQLFKALFTEDAGRRFISAIRTGIKVVRVGEDLIAIPWEFLHPVEPQPGERVGTDGFLGHDVLFVRDGEIDTDVALRMSTADTVADVDPNDPFAKLAPDERGRVALGYIVDDMLPVGKVPPDKAWHRRQKGRLACRCLKVLDASSMNRKERREALHSFAHESHDVVHFDCHVEPRGEVPQPRRFEMRVRRRHWAIPTDFRAWSLHLNPDLLVILNCCNSDVAVDGREDSFARTVRRRGGRSVIGTSARVNDAMAVEFTEMLYDLLLEPRPVGESLMAARNALLDRHGNPAALAYTLHGAASHLVRASLDDGI